MPVEAAWAFLITDRSELVVDWGSIPETINDKPIISPNLTRAGFLNFISNLLVLELGFRFDKPVWKQVSQHRVNRVSIKTLVAVKQLKGFKFHEWQKTGGDCNPKTP